MRWHDDRTIYRSLKAKSRGRRTASLAAPPRPSRPSTSTRSTGPIPETEIEEGWETLAKFKEQGKIR